MHPILVFEQTTWLSAFLMTKAKKKKKRISFTKLASIFPFCIGLGIRRTKGFVVLIFVFFCFEDYIVNLSILQLLLLFKLDNLFTRPSYFFLQRDYLFFSLVSISRLVDKNFVSIVSGSLGQQMSWIWTYFILLDLIV